MPNIVDYAMFRANTTVPANIGVGPFKISTTKINNGRGTLLRAIDDALQHWHNSAKNDPNPKNQVAALYVLAEACKRWQVESATKMTSRHNLRRHAIMSLGQSALNGVYEIYGVKRNRAAGLARPNKALEPVYSNERDHYLALKGTRGYLALKGARRGEAARYPYSSNDIVEANRILRVEQAQPPLADFHDLSLAQIQELGNRMEEVLSLKAAHVRFYNRKERMDFLVRVNAAGLLVDTEGHLKNTNKILPDGRDLVVYVMDKYGNLFVVPDTLAVGPEALPEVGYYINHSSILAGKAIVCAGTIHIQAGHLVHIDNNSGHYKPTPDDLRECLTFLRLEEGLNLTDCRVMIRNINGPDSLYQANTFLAGGRAPDWNNALDAAWNARYWS